MLFHPIFFAFAITLLIFATVFPLHIGLSSYDTDFLDYCTSIVSFSEYGLQHPFKRSLLAGIVPYILSIPFGVINGIALSSILSFFVIALAMYFYIKDFLHNSVSNTQLFLSIGFVLFTFGAVGAVTRAINYYPMIIAIFFISSWLSSKSLLYPSTKNIYWCALSIICVMCIDPRGILWGVFNIFLILIAVWQSKNLTRNLSIVCIVFILGWLLGAVIYSDMTMSLARQLDVRPLYYHLEPRNPLYAPPHLQQKGFVWGVGTISDLMYEIRFLYEQLQLPTPKRFVSSFPDSEAIYRYWLLCNILLGFGLVYLYYIFENRRKFLALLLPIIPYVGVFYQTPNLVEPHIRFFSQSLVIYAVIYSICCTFIFSKLSQNLSLVICTGIFCIHYTLEPNWSISRAMMVSELQNSNLAKKDLLQKWPVQHGQQIHLMVLPLNQEEQRIMSTWSMYCRAKLHEDQKVAPFYTLFDLELSNE